MKRAYLGNLGLIAGIALGCSGNASNTTSDPDVAGDGGSGGDGIGGNEVDDDDFLDTYEVSQARAALSRVDNCEALLTGIQNDFLVRLVESTDQLKQSLRNQASGAGGTSGGFGGSGNASGGPGWGSGGFATGGSFASGGTGGSSFPGSSSGGSGTITDGNGPLPTPPNNSGPLAGDDNGFSGTNNQVEDVDEADIIKADGDRLFVLHGNHFVVVNAWPAPESELSGSIVIEGSPRDLFVQDNHGVVFSDLWDPFNVGLALAPDSYFGGATKVTVLDISGATPTVERELYLEGSYLTSRRHDSTVRVVVQNGGRAPQLPAPNIEYTDVFGEPFPIEVLEEQIDEWLERTIRSVRSSEIGDWLSREWVKEQGVPTLLAPRCEDYFLPDPGVARPGVTNVVSFDLDASQITLDGASIFGMAERAYANTETLILASSDARFDSHVISGEQTLLHRFDLDGNTTRYTASGFVPGHIHNQFSLDEQAGIVRVSTTERRWDGLDEANPWAWAPPAPVNRVLTLQTDEDSLTILGQTTAFAENEEIFATRFIGDRGYVVTFRQTDPFFVISLSDPEHPALVGELKIPGFSEYLHPLDANHLLALGRDSQEVAGGFLDLGQALQIFDVTDPAAPKLTHKYVFESEGSSEGNLDHHAIAFYPERKLMAFPFSTWWPTQRNSLEIFEVDPNTGFSRIGGIVPDISDDECLAHLGYSPGWLACMSEEEASATLTQLRTQCAGAQTFRRGVFRGDYVYGVSNKVVQAHALLDLEEPASVVVLPSEYGYYEGAGSGAGGFGAGGSAGSFSGYAGGSFGGSFSSAGSGSVPYPYQCGGGGGGYGGSPYEGYGGVGGFPYEGTAGVGGFTYEGGGGVAGYSTGGTSGVGGANDSGL